MVYLSDIPGFDADGKLPDGVESQFASVITNITTNITRTLSDAGATFRHFVSKRSSDEAQRRAQSGLS